MWARAASFEDRVELLLRPPLGERVALSPDGQRIAYTAPTGRELTVVMRDIDPPGPKRTVKVDQDGGAATVADYEPTTHLRFLRWATANRVVFAPRERVVPLPPLADKAGRPVPNPDGPTVVSPILVADADGKVRGTLIDAPNFQETPDDARKTLADMLRTPTQLAAAHNAPVRWRMPHLDILGFLPREPDQLILQTHGAYSKPTQHLVDIRTGSVREFGSEWPAPPGEPHVFDWYRLKVVGERKDGARPITAWGDGEIATVQRELEVKFPRRVVEILDWSETRARVLCRVTGGSDAGRFFVYQRPENLVLEVLRVAPWLSAAKLNDTRFLACAAGDRAQLSGYLTWPARPRLNPPPLLVIFPGGFPGRAQQVFDPEAQVLADLGFAVLRLNHRCVAGVRPEDLNVLRAAVDRVAVDDARATLDWIASHWADRAFDRKRVAALGRGFGGYLAVRALQLEPAVFRGGIAIDAPLDLRTWLRPSAGVAAAARDIPVTLIDHAGADWKNLSAVEHADALTNPVLLFVEPGRSPAVDASTGELRVRLQRLGRTAEHCPLDAAFAAARPLARAAVYRKIDDFLNVHLDAASVKIGTAKEVQ